MNEITEIKTQRKIVKIYKKYIVLISTLIIDSDYVFDIIFYKKLFDLIDDMYSKINITINTEMTLNIKRNYNLLYDITETKPIKIDITKILKNPNTKHTINFELNRNKRKLKNTLKRYIEQSIKMNKSLDDINKYIKNKVYNKVYGKTKGDGYKTLRIFRTEYTRTRTEAKLKAIENLRKEGYKITRNWLYTYESKVPRPSHLSSNGITDDGNGYFIIDGYKTKGPGLFGIASEDINCRCDTECYCETVR